MHIPKLRQDFYFPGLLEARRRAIARRHLTRPSAWLNCAPIGGKGNVGCPTGTCPGEPGKPAGEPGQAGPAERELPGTAPGGGGVARAGSAGPWGAEDILRVAFMFNDDAHMDLLRQWMASSMRLADKERLADSSIPPATLTPA